MNPLLVSDSPGITPDGRDCVLWALDPCADQNRQPVGLCDTDSTPTVPLVYTAEYAISNPASTTYSACVFTLPTATQLAINGFSRCTTATPGVQAYNTSGVTQQYTYPVGQYIDQQSTTSSYNTSTTVGLVNVWTWATDSFGGGGVALPDGTNGWAYPAARNAMGPAIYAGQGTYRVTGLAIEVIDVTPPLYQAGVVTTSRTPQRQSMDLTYNLSDFAPSTGWWSSQLPAVPRISGTMPPATVSKALQYQTTTQWPMKEGVYAVASFDLEKNPLTTVGFGYASYLGSSAPTAVTGVSGMGVPTIGRTGANGVSYTPIPQPMMWCPIDNTCIYMTGLPVQGAYIVRVRYILEVAPQTNIGDQFNQLVPAARASPVFDPVALEAYQRIARGLPAAVPYGMNPAGEWFGKVKEALSKVVSAITPVAKAALPAVADLVGGKQAMKAANSFLSNYDRDQRVAINKQPQNKQQKQAVNSGQKQKKHPQQEQNKTKKKKHR
jgi:hypothetical protein